MTSADTQSVRSEVRQWLAENWNAADPGDDWLERVVDAGWAAPTWPEHLHGRGLDSDAAAAIVDEFRRVGAPGTGQDRTNLWAATLTTYGKPELVNQFVRDLLTNKANMCLLYSEPGAGSDLAGVQTKAERDGDEWVVNGQKVWTSSGRSADWGMLIARTDWDVPKHAGISFFWLPMRQPGVEVRALRQATGDSRFNEVFITDARVPDSHMLGQPGEGWRVLQTALAYERSAMSGALGSRRRKPATKPDAGDETPAPAPDLSLLDLARATGKQDDPVVRQRLMHLRSLVAVNEWNNQRAKAAMSAGTSTPIVSLGKLAMSRILHTAGSLETELLGAEGTLAGESSPRSAEATYSLLNAFFTSIGGGTDQIQRNIIGEHILGLPKEPEVDKGVAFRQVLRSPATTNRD